MSNELYTEQELENYAAVNNAMRVFTGALNQVLVYQTGPCYRPIQYTFVHVFKGKYKLFKKEAK